MLGKRSCLLRKTSSRSFLIPCEHGEGQPTLFWNNAAQVTERDHRPALSAPCKVVIGFDLGTEKKALSDACESPRSVLDTLALLAPPEKQHVVVARSPRSCLGSLLTATSGSGVELEVVAQTQGNGVGMPVDSVPGSFGATFHSRNRVSDTSSEKMSLFLKLGDYQLKDPECLGKKASSSDFMDADISSSWRRQAHHALCVEDEHSVPDISPRHSQVMFAPSSQDMTANNTEAYIPSCQSRALSSCIENGSKEGCLKVERFPQCSHGPWEVGSLQLVPRNSTNTEHIKACLPTWQSGVAPYGPGIEGAVSGCESDGFPTWEGEVWSLCDNKCTGIRSSASQGQALHHVSLDMECEEIGNEQSIFSATSPPSCSHSQAASFSGFLKVCSFCGHSLRMGKDIFMYRGDQGFCSAECRYQKIVLDEGKEKQGK